ncbi:MAG: hypothetical protein QN147_01225 [Armatimonadota bacterium]|nr:hypothetical protein [Armatimonadota bacterium]MDR7510628.1 hypothetical protein [Armatimonadota bacterium]
MALAAAALVAAAMPSATPTGAAPAGAKRIAFLVDSWYPWSHADVIGTRFLAGYRVGDRTVASPLGIASVYTDAPRATDQTRALGARHGFRIAGSIAEALLADPGAARPRLDADGVLVATREDLPDSGQPQSPRRRVEVMREVYRLLDLTGARVPVFVDKMLAASWQDSQAITSEAARRGIPLMAGSVLPFTPLSRPLHSAGVQVGVVVASTPYWAFGFHAAELLQGFMEQRAARETGVREVREVGAGYWTMPDREGWGGRVMDALLASPRTGRGGGGPVRGDARVLLITYADGARGVLALVPDRFDDSEFLLGAQYGDGTVATSGLVLGGQPYDHFGYLVHALVQLYTTGRSPVPVERTLLSTAIVIAGVQAARFGQPVRDPALAVSYTPPRGP